MAKRKNNLPAGSVLVELTRQADFLTRKDIASWRRAWQAALNVDRPDRRALYDIYTDSLIDNHLTGCIGQRKALVMQRSFKLADIGGIKDEEATALFDSAWFKRLLSLAMDSRFWGHSLIELGEPEKRNGRMRYSYAALVPRKHVVPEYGVILRDQGDDISAGIRYREGEMASWVVEAGEPFDLGLLLKTAPQTISKRYALAFWDQFAEIFGIPMRIAKTDIRDKAERQRIYNSLRDMGTTNFGVLPDGTEIDIKESSRSDAFNVFDQRVERANSEISKAIVGQTMTSDNGSSKSQGEVHLHILEGIAEEDADFIRDLINDELLPRMTAHGFPVDGLRFDWDDRIDYTPEQQVAIESMILTRYDIDPKYWEEKYGIKVTGERQALPMARDFFA